MAIYLPAVLYSLRQPLLPLRRLCLSVTGLLMWPRLPFTRVTLPWSSLGLMPVMFLGPVVAVASLITTLLV